jgi:hypothetical protein
VRGAERTGLARGAWGGKAGGQSANARGRGRGGERERRGLKTWDARLKESRKDGGSDALEPNFGRKKVARLGVETMIGRKRLQNAVERAYFQVIWCRTELRMSAGRQEVFVCFLIYKMMGVSLLMQTAVMG